MTEQTHQLVAIMFTDIVGYTAMMDEDEDKAFHLLEKNRLIQKPIIEKQGKIIEKQEEKEKIHQENVLGNIAFNLRTARRTLLQIKKSWDETMSYSEVIDSSQAEILSLKIRAEQIMNVLNENIQWVGSELSLKIDKARARISVYVKQMENKNDFPLEFSHISDPKEPIKFIENALEKLPPEGPA